MSFFKAMVDELEKLGAVTDDQAEAALDRLDTLERQKPTAGQVARYSAIGAVGGAGVGAIRNAISGTPGGWRGHVGNAIGGAVSAGAIPIVQKHLDRKAEERTIKNYLEENDKTAAASVVKPPTIPAKPPAAPRSTVPPAKADLPPPPPSNSLSTAAPVSGAVTAPSQGSIGDPLAGFKPPPQQTVAPTDPIKLAFSTNAFSGPMNPGYNSTASRQQPGFMPRADKGGSPVPGGGFSPTRGGFLLASGVQGPLGLTAKTAKGRNTFYDFPENVAKLAKKMKILCGDHAQYLLDKERGDGVDRGRTKEKDSESLDNGYYPYNPGDFKRAKLSSAWAHHAALNGGQAAHAAEFLFEHPEAQGQLESAGLRIPEVLKNLGYAVAPPQLHHNAAEIKDLEPGDMKDWWRAGHDPDAPMPKHAFKLQGHTEHQGLPIAIENRKGSVRKGVDKDGKPWRTEMKHPYGYIKGSKGADGEEVDCYVGPVADASHAHVVHQHKSDGKGYDEDKVMLGFGSKEEARKAYLAHYDDPKFLGPMKSVPVEKLKQLIESGKKLIKISSLPGAKFKTPNVLGSSVRSIEEIAKPIGFGRKGAVAGTLKAGNI